LLTAFGSAVTKVESLLGLAGSICAVSDTLLQPKSKRKRPLNKELIEEWHQFSAELEKCKRQVAAAESMFAFSFIEGAFVKALRYGHWILLDEINLAPIETLERLTGVLEGDHGSLSLTERGDIESIPRHPDFRVFACMNPATDVGKHDLPLSLKTRFTEFYINELTTTEDLETFVFQYLGAFMPSPPVSAVVTFYQQAQQEAETRLFDSANQKPRYSLRSLARALEYSQVAMPLYGFARALYDGICMTFLTLLDPPSRTIMENLILVQLMRKIGVDPKTKSLLAKIPSQPSHNHVQFEHFWLEKGNIEVSESCLEFTHRYVVTQTRREHLQNLAKAVFIRKYPVLLQGPTSSGKTSLVEYLATVTCHRFVRINNHEHTDLQEYLGTYVTDSSGKLVFQEGILVEAVRNGYWIVLDELNLAPSEVLEALNRLLDDNRELFVPELQMVVKPHPHFMLFATQNPPGAYGGRKVLSRAFRNRFLELHVDDIPEFELCSILEKRCEVPKSYADKMVDVMRDLQRNRQASQAFAGKHGFMTPRDLFRWADRHRKDGISYEDLARVGYMLLAERLRESNERQIVLESLEKNLRVKIDISQLYAEVSQQNRKDNAQ
jgi:midasin